MKVELKCLKSSNPSLSGMCGCAVEHWAAKIAFLANDPLTDPTDRI